MIKQFTFLVGIGFLNLFVFAGIFNLLQNDKIYQNSLGRISQNYEKVEHGEEYEIFKTSKPFQKINDQNFLMGDAGIYKCISERMYRPEQNCYGTVRAAFFPLFPLLWKLVNGSPWAISFLNYCMFFCSIAILVMLLLKTTFTNKLIFYSVLITLPSTIIYYIPYTEALFLFTMTIASVGILKNKYWLYFLGFFLMAMVRPATAFILLSIWLAEILLLVREKDIRQFFKNIIFRTFPFIIGYFLAFFIQYRSSGSWTSYIDAQKHWGGKIQFMDSISDWSIEGFGLSSFALFFVGVPSFILVISKLVKWEKILAMDSIKKTMDYKIEYLGLISVFYLAGMFVFTLLTSGGSLHSYFRFTLTSPPFYIVTILFLNYVLENPIKPVILLFSACIALLSLWLYFVSFGGDRFQFSFFGLYLFLATSFFMIVKINMSLRMQISILIVLIILSTIWNAYLLNDFYCDGWLFT